MTEVKSGIEGKELKKELENLINPLKGDTLKVYFTGMPLITAEISENSSKTMRLGLISAIVVLLALYFCFRSLRGVFLPIIVSIFSSIWVLGFIALSGRSVTMIASVLPVVMISLATAYGIHFINRYYEERHNVGIKNSVGMAIYDTSMPILMSALTTMAGFLSLSAAVLRPMTEFALFSALGMFFAFVLSIFFLGSFLTIFPPKKVHAKFSYKSNDIISRLLKLISLSVLKEKKVIIVILSILLITSLGFGFRVRPESSMESKLGEENELVKSLTYFKENFGGTDSLYVYVTSNNVKNPYILREVKKVEDYSKQVSGLSEPYSIADFVIQLNDAMENKKIVPASPEKIDNLWFFAGDNSYITSMIGEDNKDTLINVKATAMSFQGLQQSIETMEQFIRNIPKKVKKIEFASLQEENKLNYYNHLAEEIISSLEAKGVTINDQEKYKEVLIKIAAKPDSDFNQDNQGFVNEILKISSLEIEDLGLSPEKIEPILTSYIRERKSVNLFIAELREKLELSEDDATYLQEVLEDSRAIAQKREKVKFAQLETARFLDTDLNDEEKDILWYLMDESIYVPDNKGDIEISFRLTGTPVITDKVNSSLLRGQVRSIFLALLAVLILLILQFKSFILGLFGMIPITLTSFTSFGIMGILNIELNVATIGVASIAIGAGIDYTIHYISRYKAELTRKSKTAAMKTTLTGTGRAIIFNSISVAAGFFALNFSDIGMIGTFGNLIGSIMLISVIYALLLLPILLNTIKLKEEKKNEI
jgi:predicted RND superfamily exporter protein